MHIQTSLNSRHLRLFAHPFELRHTLLEKELLQRQPATNQFKAAILKKKTRRLKKSTLMSVRWVMVRVRVRVRVRVTLKHKVT